MSTFLPIGKGPLQTTMSVIDSAKRISEAGTKLDKLARQIADQCPESSTKKDLLAYLQRIALYCHQLNITSKVTFDNAVDHRLLNEENQVRRIRDHHSIHFSNNRSKLMCKMFPVS